VAGELDCDWHTVNDAVLTYGEALLAADRKRLNQTTAIGLDETSFVKTEAASHAAYATTVADVENHQIIDILPTRAYVDVAGWIDKQPRAWKERIRYGALDMSATYAAVYSVILPRAAQVVDPFHVIALANRCLDAVRRRSSPNRPATGDEETIRSFGSVGAPHRRREARRQSHRASVVTARAGRPERRGGHRLPRQGAPADFYRTSDPDEAARCSTSSNATA